MNRIDHNIFLTSFEVSSEDNMSLQVTNDKK